MTASHKDSKTPKRITKYLPANLDVDALLKEHPLPFKDTHPRDRLICFLSLIFENPALKHLDYLYDGYTPIHAKTLEKTIPLDWKYKEYLKAQGIIECDESYVKGVKSKGYRFSKKYRYSPITDTSLSDPKFIEKVIEHDRVDEKTAVRYDYLWKHFNDNLTIDHEAALEYNKAHFTSPRWITKIRGFSRHHYFIPSIFKLRDHAFIFKVDKFGHRLHSNLSGLKREFRQFVSYDGQQLVEIDIGTAQPFLSQVLLESAFYDASCDLMSYGDCNEPSKNQVTLDHVINHRFSTPDENEEEEVYKVGKKIKTKAEMEEIRRENLAAVLSLLPQLQTDPKQFEELLKFKKEVASDGDLYEFIMNNVNTGTERGQLTADEFYTRDEIKLGMLKVFFSGNQFIGQPDAFLKRKFKELFGSVYQVYATFKRNDKSRLAKILQCIESFLILDIIAKKISTDHPTIPIFTIHDSIVTTLGNEAYVSQIMSEELTRYIHATPKLKITHWTREVEVPKVNKMPSYISRFNW